MNAKLNFRWVFRVFFVLIAMYALVGHFFQIVIYRSPEVTALGATIDYFSYFTIQSNWLVVLWWIFAILVSGNATRWWFLSPKVKGALTVYITVTFIVYAVLLADLWQPTGFDRLFATVTHYVTPLAFILDWLLFEQRGVYQWRFLLNWLIYPAAYMAYALIYGAMIQRALYPFFDHVTLGWGGMLLQVSVLVVFMIGLGSIYIGINRLMGKLQPSA